MRIGIEQVDDTMERHIKEGLDAMCKRLDFDAQSVIESFALSYGPDRAPLLTGMVTVGIDIGLAVAAETHKEVHADVGLHESEHHHDEFLESLPESHPYDLAKSSEPFANQLKRESDERTR